MIGVYLTIAISIITLIFWNAIDYYYRKNPMKLYRIKHEGKSSWDEIVSIILCALSIIGMAYSVVYFVFLGKQ